VEVTGVTWHHERLSVTVAKRGRQPGELVFTVPPTFHPTSVRLNGKKRRRAPRVSTDGLVSVGLLLDDRRP